MTAPKSTLRPRRRTGPEILPDDLVAWFEGKQSSPPWCALLPGPNDGELLPQRWRAWKTSNQGARPPVGYEWLDDQCHPRRAALGIHETLKEMNMETAARRGRRTKRDLQEIPEFLNFLKREGLTFEEWERQQRLTASPDATSEALALAWRKANLKRAR